MARSHAPCSRNKLRCATLRSNHPWEALFVSHGGACRRQWVRSPPPTAGQAPDAQPIKMEQVGQIGWTRLASWSPETRDTCSPNHRQTRAKSVKEVTASRKTSTHVERAARMTKVNFVPAHVERKSGRNQFAEFNRQAMTGSFHKK